MKYKCSVIIISILISAMVLPGCPRRIGQCRYGESTWSHGEVTIISIEKIADGNREFMKVGVHGFFQRTIVLTPDNYEKCIVSKGLGIGSKVEGTIAPGGPCPPMFKIGNCPW